MHEIFVSVAIREGSGTVGYFDVSKGEVPSGWQYLNYMDISDIMYDNNLNKQQALLMMNGHWQIP